MKLIFTSYASAPEFDNPVAWLKRIEGYTGIPEALAQNNTVISIERINYEGNCVQNGVCYYFVQQKKKTVLIPAKIHRRIKKEQPDIVFINGFIFPLQIMQLRWKLGRKKKIIVINQAEKPWRGIKKYLQKLADRCVDAYLFTSLDFGYEWVGKGNISSHKKIYEVFHGSSVFSPAGKASARMQLSVSGSPVYLWVGRLDANKDPLTVIKAFMRLLKLQPSATLYMIYHTEELLPAVKEIIATDEVAQKNIYLIGPVPHPQLQDWFNAADFFISASYFEGGGIALCEAMSCGCIPIVTAIDSFRRLTGEGKVGILFPPGGEDALVQALQQSVQMNREAGRNNVLEQFNLHFSFKAIGLKIEQVIKKLYQTKP
jgi:glycosyltransferase involved in cell wall biosynthesis